MVARRESLPMTVEEWRELERTSHDVKHEYIDGQIYAMSGGSLTHSRISLNVCAALESALAAAGKSCSVYNSDAATRLSATRYTYPDAVVTCDERDRPTPNKTEVQFPRLVVEVLSDSTEAYDRGRKFGYYRACQHIQEYVMIDVRYQMVEVYRRSASLWNYQVYGPGEDVECTGIGVHVSVAALYRNAGVPVFTDDVQGAL